MIKIRVYLKDSLRIYEYEVTTNDQMLEHMGRIVSNGFYMMDADEYIHHMKY